MRKLRWMGWALVMVGLAGAAGAQAADALYAIGPDGNGVGRVLSTIDTGTGSATPVATLGDGSLAFNGGLAWSASAGALFAVENDASGNSFLTSFSPNAPTTLSTPIALGQGFGGGLAATGSGALYAIGSDAFGQSSFYGVGAGGATLLGAIGTGFAGGLTWDAATAAFYAIGADASGVQTQLARITLGGSGLAVTSLFSLGSGDLSFAGGLAWDAAGSRFLTVGSDAFGNASLYSFQLGGAGAVTRIGAVGPGFVDAGLAFAPAAAVPEPASTALLLVGLAAFLTLRHRPSRSAKES